MSSTIRIGGKVVSPEELKASLRTGSAEGSAAPTSPPALEEKEDRPVADDPPGSQAPSPAKSNTSATQTPSTSQQEVPATSQQKTQNSSISGAHSSIPGAQTKAPQEPVAHSTLTAQVREQATQSSGSAAQPKAQNQSQPFTNQREKNMSKEIGIGSYNNGGVQISPGLVQDAGLTKFSETIDLLIKNSTLSGYNINMRTVAVRSDAGQNVSYVLIEALDNRDNPTAVAYTAIVLAASVGLPQWPSNRYQIRNQGYGAPDTVIDIPLADSDVVDRNLLSMITARVQRAYPKVQASNLFMAEPVVIPRVFNYASEDLIRQVLISSFNSVNLRLHTNLGEKGTFRDFSLVNRQTRGTEDVEVVYTEDASINELGLPVRADLRVIISTAQNNNNNQQRNQVTINGDQAAQLLAEADAFVDLAWDCAQAPISTLLAGLPVQAPTQSVPKMYHPRVVFTRLRTMQVSSLPMQLLTLGTAIATLQQDGGRRVREYFVTATKAGNNPFRDIAGLGYDIYNQQTGGAQRTPLQTKGETAPPAQLMQLLDLVFHPTTYALDVPEYGPDSWQLTPFLSAAGGQEAALHEIWDAADLLTGGHFNNICNEQLGGRRPVPVINDNNRIHAGVYTDGTTQRLVDLRQIDYLLMVNRYGAEQLEEVNIWSQSFAANNSSVEQRVAKRWEQIYEVTAGSVTQTGWHRRVTVGGDFASVLIQAIGRCEYSPNIRDSHNFGVSDVRANASFLSGGALTGLGGQQFFNQAATGGSARQGMPGMITRFENFMGN